MTVAYQAPGMRLFHPRCHLHRGAMCGLLSRTCVYTKICSCLGHQVLCLQVNVLLLTCTPLQAKAVQQHIKQMGIKVDIVIVSPLTRALETAVGCFGNFSAPLNGTPPLMMELTEQQGRRAAHPAVSAEGCPPIVCYELCR
eukprot:GHUV01040511.1.p1 GENE.GHUV01040511.1~~GHUV01040511.1.p1  ORF type:complete len:141 (-),score=16.92 GHUV01040511.1:385-807(-)